MKKLVLSLGLALLIIGCGGEKSIIPITVGNDWNYGLTTIMTGTVNDTMTGSQTLQISRETTLDNETGAFEVIFRMEYDDTLVTGTTDTMYFVETDDYLLVYSSKSDTEPDTHLVFPVETGNTWTVHKDTSSTQTATVLGKKNVNVPAGTYNDCWEIGYIYDGETTYTYWAPGTGNVKSYMYMQDTMSIEMTLELESATIK